MTPTRYYININITGTPSPVHIEQTNTALNVIVSETLKSYIYTKYNIKNLDEYDTLMRSMTGNVRSGVGKYFTNITLIGFIRTLIKFKSKVKGVVKLRQALAEGRSLVTYVDNENDLFLNYYEYDRYCGITMNRNTRDLIYNILKEQYNRWQKIKLKYKTFSEPLELVDKFLEVAIGQSDIYDNKLYLLGCLDYLGWYLEYLEHNRSESIDSKPFNITSQEQFTHLYYSWAYVNSFNQKIASFTSYKMDKLGLIFALPKKPLPDLMKTFTCNPTEVKFITQYGKVIYNN